jgi:hypothetical protein
MKVKTYAILFLILQCLMGPALSQGSGDEPPNNGGVPAPDYGGIPPPDDGDVPPPPDDGGVQPEPENPGQPLEPQPVQPQPDQPGWPVPQQPEPENSNQPSEPKPGHPVQPQPENSNQPSEPKPDQPVEPEPVEPEPFEPEPFEPEPAEPQPVEPEPHIPVFPQQDQPDLYDQNFYGWQEQSQSPDEPQYQPDYDALQWDTLPDDLPTMPFTDAPLTEIPGTPETPGTTTLSQVQKIRLAIAVEAIAGALPKSNSSCAKYVRKAIERAYKSVTGTNKSVQRTLSAKDYGPNLKLFGFQVVPGPAEEGDVAIFNSVPNHPHGHIQIFTDKGWVSDFTQKSIYPATAYKNETPVYYRYIGI